MPAHMQFLAARSRWTNFLLARYSIPLATCSPKPIRSLTVGFWKNQLQSPCCTSSNLWNVSLNELKFWCRNLQHAYMWALTCPSSRMKLRRSPCFIYGRTTRGEPSGGRQIPNRERTLGWLKSFMMIPSFRNWDTSSKSVMPDKKKISWHHFHVSLVSFWLLSWNISKIPPVKSK